jgi:amino acid adenylation domain-containing protein
VTETPADVAQTVTADPAPPPLSVAQEALWYVSLLAPNRISYNETISIRKDGPLDLGALRRAFDEIVRRHQAWRTTFDSIGAEGVQVVRPAPSFDLPVIDLGHLTRDQAERRAVQLVAEVSRVPYDVRRGPLLRPRLVRFPGDHHRLYLALHHLCFDGVSVYRVVLPELVLLYEAYCAGRPSPLAEPRTQYADYARWEQKWITEPRAARRLKYWREHLTSLPELSLPLDRPRPPAPRHRGGVIPLSVPKAAVDRLRDVGQSVGASLFQVLATVWALLLGRYSGQHDVVFATAADLRQRPELESVVGYCLTPLVLRIDLSGDPTFTDAVIRVRNELLDSLDQLVPFERLVRELPPGGVANANPVYQTMLVLEPPTVAPDPAWSIHQMESEIGDAVGAAKLDLELELDQRPEGHIAGRLIYDRDLFETATAARMAEHWLHLIAAVADDPSLTVTRVPILNPAQAHRQLVEWNATTTERRIGALDELVRASVDQDPDSAAVSAGGQTISYRDLDSRAGRIASRLETIGVGPGDVVAVCSQPSLDLVAGALGVLKAGAAYLLLDPELPPEQLDFIVGDAGAAVMVAQPALVAALAAPPARLLVLDESDDQVLGESGGGGPALPAAPAGPDELSASPVCCVQYTSSLTGTPSGVALRHASAVNLAAAMAADLGIGPADRVLVLPSTCFQVAVLELWLALIAGARMVVAPAEAARNGAELSRLIASERVTFLHARPSIWQTLIETGLKPARALRALSGGEPLSRELADQILERCQVLWNAYGAVETTAYSAIARVEPSAPVTIGRPIANTRVYVLDAHDQPVPVGVTGALLVSGDGVASGYRNRAELTAAAFVADPFGSGTAFRTGDLARWLPDGELAFVGTQAAGEQLDR